MSRAANEALRNKFDFVALQEELRAEMSAPLEHLPYEQLAAYVDDAMSDAARETVEGHLLACALCEAEMKDLLAFKESLTSDAVIPRATVSVPANSLWRKFSALVSASVSVRLKPFGVAASLATLTLAFTFAAWFVLRSGHPTPDTVAKVSEPRTGAETSVSSVNNMPPQAGADAVGSPKMEDKTDAATALTGRRDEALSKTSPATQRPQLAMSGAANSSAPQRVAAQLALNDGGRVLIDGQGNLRGLEQVPLAYRRAVQRALTSQQLDVSNANFRERQGRC